MKRTIARFMKSEDAAVTVDFVVLTAALIFMVMGIFQLLTKSVYEEAGARMAEQIAESAARP